MIDVTQELLQACQMFTGFDRARPGQATGTVDMPVSIRCTRVNPDAEAEDETAGRQTHPRWTFAAGRITALGAFLFEVAMPNINFRSIVIVFMLLGVAVGGVIAGAVVLAWPHVWGWIKPLLHAATA